MKKLEAEITIDAPPSVVWEILVDLDRYAEWNPFVVEAEGTVDVGSKLRLRLLPPGGRGTTFRPTVTIADPERDFEWLGHLGFAGVFDGRHHFHLEPLPNGTRFVQSEEFTGVMVPVFARSLDTNIRAGFEALNQAIKARAEAAHA
jgi:hypothetical protein